MKLLEVSGAVRPL